jgi:hypothetical protein
VASSSEIARSSVRSIQFEIERPSRSATFSIASRKAGVIHTLTEAVRVPRRAIANRPPPGTMYAIRV